LSFNFALFDEDLFDEGLLDDLVADDFTTTGVLMGVVISGVFRFEEDFLLFNCFEIVFLSFFLGLIDSV